jgi:hypothetical protein
MVEHGVSSISNQLRSAPRRTRWDRHARRAERPEVGRQDAAHADRLGQAIALECRHERGREELLRAPAEGGAAAEHVAQPAAGLGLDLVEDDSVGKAGDARKAVLLGSKLRVVGQLEDAARDGAGRRDLEVDALTDRLPLQTGVSRGQSQ